LENHGCAGIVRIQKHHLNGCHDGACVVCGNKKDKNLSNDKLMEVSRALVHCSGYNEERRGMMEIGIE
jgi:hypothetical protein